MSELSTQITSGPLSKWEQDRETVINGLRTYYEVGDALARIQANKSFKLGGYASFKECCEHLFNITRQRAHQLMDAVTITNDIKALPAPNHDAASTRVDVLPTEEAQCRLLKSLTSEQRRAVWTEAVQQANGTPNTKFIKAAKAKILGEPAQLTCDTPPGNVAGNTAPIPETDTDFRNRIIAKLKTMPLPNAREWFKTIARDAGIVKQT